MDQLWHLRDLERRAFSLLIRYLRLDPEDDTLFWRLAETSEAISDFQITEESTVSERVKYRNLLVVQRLINLVVLGRCVDGTLRQALRQLAME